MFTKRIIENLLARSRMRKQAGNSRSNRESADDELHILELENRILYDAAPIDIDAHTPFDHVEPGDFSALMDLAAQLNTEQAADETSAWWLQENLTDDQSALLDKYAGAVTPLDFESSSGDETDIAKQWESLERLFNEFDADTDNETLVIDSSENPDTIQTKTVSDLIFVDTSIDDHETLLSDVLGRVVDPHSVAVIYIDQDSDGITQISDAVSQYDDLYAIHLLSHGSAGELHLGSATLSIENVDSYAEQFGSWRNSLAVEADLLIYGCDVAGTADGQQLLERIGTISGTDVAASDDLTGDTVLGGDWDLEYRFGRIEADLIQLLAGDNAWSGTLGELSTESDNSGAHRALAIDANGNRVTVWTDSQGDLDAGSNASSAVYFQRIDFQGNLVGSNVQVNEHTDGDQKWASVATDEHGNFVVTWTSEGQNGQTSGIYARMFDSNGKALADEFLVSGSELTEFGKNSSIAMNSAGEFIIAWEGAINGLDSTGVFAQRFESDGSLYGGIFQVNSSTAGTQSGAVVSLNDDQEAVVAWTDGVNLFAQQLEFDDGLDGSEITVRSGNAFIQYHQASVDINQSGDFIVSYTAETPFFPDLNILVSAFDSDGDANGGLIVANDTLIGLQFNSQISYADDGSFVVVWEGYGPTDNDGVFKREFDGVHSAGDTEQRVNSEAAGDQSFPGIDHFPDGSYEIVYTEQDGMVYSVLSSNFSGGPTNQAPESDNATVEMISDSPYAFSPNDFEYSDYESDTFDFVKISELPDKGTLMLNNTAVTEDQEISVDDITNGLLVYLNDPGESGTGYTSFEFNVKDSNRYSLDEYEMSVDVVAAPLLDATDAVSVDENDSFVKHLVADNPRGPVAYTIKGGDDAALFDLDASTGVLTFVNAPDYENPTDAGENNVYEVIVEASDGSTSTLQSVTVSVDPLNDNSPAFTTPNTAIVDENESAVLTVNATDDDQPTESITYSITGGDDRSKFEIDSDTGELIFKKNPDFENPRDMNRDNVYQVTVTAVDDGGKSSDQTISIRVDPVNETAPTFTTTDKISVAENSRSVLTVNAADHDLSAEAITYSISGGADADRFSIDGTSGELIFKDARDFEKAEDADKDNLYEVTVTADDNNGNSSSQEITVTVTNEEENPDIRNEFMSVDENSGDGTLVGKIRLGDHDNQSHTFTITDGDSNNAFAIDDNGHVTILDPSQIDFEQQSTWTLDVTVEDSVSNVDSATVTIELSDLVEIPEVKDQGWSLDENPINGTFVGTIHVDDLDAGHSVTFAWTQTDGTLLLDETTGDIFVADSSKFDFELVQSIDAEVRITDSFGNIDDATLTFTINDENETPIVGDDSFSVDAGGRLVVGKGEILANDEDPEMQTLRVSLVDDVQNGRLVLHSNGRFVFVPNDGFIGTDSFTYLVTDGENVSETATVEIEVNAVSNNNNEPSGIEGQDGSPSGENDENAAGGLSAGLISPDQSQDNTPDDEFGTLPDSSAGESVQGFSAVSSELVSFDLSADLFTSSGSTEFIYTSINNVNRTDFQSGGFQQGSSQAPGAISSLASNNMMYMADNEELWNELGDLTDEVVTDPMFSKVTLTGAAGFTGAVTVTYVLWLIRGGYLMASVLSSLPAWRYVDPLPILDVLEGTGGEDGESIESIIREANSVSDAN